MSAYKVLVLIDVVKLFIFVCIRFQEEAHLGVTAGDVDGVEAALVPFVSVDKFPVWLLLRRIFLGVLDT